VAAGDLVRDRAARGGVEGRHARDPAENVVGRFDPADGGVYLGADRGDRVGRLATGDVVGVGVGRNDYACPFWLFIMPVLSRLFGRNRRLAGRTRSTYVKDYACPFPFGFGILNARILLPPRPVVNDYACPFVVFFSRPVVNDYACPFGLRLASGGRPHSPLRSYPQKSPMDPFCVLSKSSPYGSRRRSSRIMPVLLVPFT
jgi:hypothetical protein